jgi:hypothetical protein
MGVRFIVQVARVGSDKQVVPLEGPENRFGMSSSALYNLLEVVADRKGLVLREAETWPWYFGSHDGTGRHRPSPVNCFDPGVVLRSLQELERDLRKYEKATPGRWEFTWADSSGRWQQAEGLQVVYRDRNCLLFGDDEGVWFKETDAGPRQSVHHKLGRPLEVVVRLPGASDDTVVGVRRISHFRDCENDLASFKRLCIRAMEERALLFTSAG